MPRKKYLWGKMETKKVRFSLKLKILLSIVALLFLAIWTNLYFATDIFLKDKTSYIYETGLNRSQQLTSKLTSKINDYINKTVLYSLVNKVAPAKLATIIDSEKDLLFYAVSSLDGKTNEIFLKNKSDEFKKITSKIDGANFTFEKVFGLYRKDQGQEIQVYSTTNKFKVPSLVAFVKNEGANELYAIGLSLHLIKSEFKTDNIFHNILIDNDGNSFLNDVSDIEDAKSYINEILENPISKGTREVKSRIGKDLLISFIKYEDFNINVISGITKKRAFLVAQKLLEKAVIFGVGLMALSIILGTLLSFSITKPISSLLEGTRNVAKGMFDKKIEVKTKDELFILGDSFNYMSSEIQSLLESKEVIIEELRVAQAKLEDYSKNLEKMVEQRTIELKRANDFMAAMVDSLDQGLMVFDKNNMCNERYTKACEDIFGIIPAGKSVTSVLGIDQEKDISAFNSWSSILFSEKIPFNSSVQLGPQNKVFGENVDDEGFKFIELEYFPMRNDDGAIGNIVAVATDKTEEVKAREQFKEKEAYVSMILKMINNKRQFFSFLEEVDSSIKLLEKVIKDDGEFEISQALIYFHSLNGGFGLYSVFNLQQLARTYEQELVELKESGRDISSYGPQLRSNIDHFKNEYSLFLNECSRIFGDNYQESKNSIEIPKSTIEDLYQRAIFANDKEMVEFCYENFVKEPVLSQFKGYAELIQNLATTLNKNIKPVDFKNSELRVDVAKNKELFSVMVHLFRNCVDHGIEHQSERVDLGKDPAGLISVAFQENDNMLEIIVQDDGGGIDPQKIRDKLYSLNPDGSYDDIPDEKIIYHIFDPMFSTAEEVTSVSGRGVGMSAIKDVIDKRGGKIYMKSIVNRGTTFRFSVPLT